ncbi:hypothetical protein Trydic_g17101 [Trypoxylus dichotomus]
MTVIDKSIISLCFISTFVKLQEQHDSNARSLTVAIVDKDKSEVKCGGILIRPSYVVTAGHCVKKDNSSAYVVVYNTSTFALTENYYNSIPVKAISFRGTIGISCEDKDIALLKLDGMTAHDEFPILSKDNKDLKDAFLNKWSDDKTANDTIYRLETIPIEIYGAEVCRKANEKKKHIYRNICGAPTNGSLIPGNSGSPLLIQMQEGLVMIGILYCKINGVINATYPAAFVRISQHYKWIEEQIASTEENENQLVQSSKNQKEDTILSTHTTARLYVVYFVYLLMGWIILVLTYLVTTVYHGIRSRQQERNMNMDIELEDLNIEHS